MSNSLLMNWFKAAPKEIVLGRKYIGIFSCCCSGSNTRRRSLLSSYYQHYRTNSTDANMDSANPPPLVSDLVLIGGGHAHVHVLKMCGMSPLKESLKQSGIRVTLISDTVLTPYSGMLPGYIAGHYTWEEIHLDLNKLCQFGDVTFVNTAATEIKQSTSGQPGLIYCRDDRPPIRYDVLSIDVGITPAGLPISSSQKESVAVTAVKPISGFAAKYDQVRQRLQRDYQKYTKEKPFVLAVVGGGAGGIELALASQYNLKSVLKEAGGDEDALKVVVATRGKKLLDGHNTSVQKIFQRILKDRDVTILYETEVTDIVPVDDNDGSKGMNRFVVAETNSKQQNRGETQQQSTSTLSTTTTTSSTTTYFHECLWCTSAGAAPWLSQKTPFDTNEQGFLNVKDTYQLTSHSNVFAAGDCCYMINHPRPKAGVFAVRAGPPLKDNLVAYLLGNALVDHKPQSTFLGLISTGDQYAVASKGSMFALEGAYLWNWKDHIDRKWMNMYQDLPKMDDDGQEDKGSIPNNVSSKGADAMVAFAAATMRCGGCGAKVGATTVSRVLDAIRTRQQRLREQRALVENGDSKSNGDTTSKTESLPNIDYDDAAVIPLPAKGGGSMIQTIDFFRSFISDPYVFGRIAAVHALSDCHAMGADAQTALALAVVPYAAEESITERTLLSMLAGASDALEEDGCQLVGGHTCEGAEQALGFSVTGIVDDSSKLLRKKGGRPGDVIVLTKPIGTGALFAADMRVECDGIYVQEALQSMMQSNRKASRVAMNIDKYGPSVITSCTDVTGFGLMGHLLEMLMANDREEDMESIGANLDLDSIPMLKGGLEASKKEIFSSLQKENARSRRAVSNHVDVASAEPIKYSLLFDPQTAGGLLMFVSKDKVEQLVQDLKLQGYQFASIIGEVKAFEQPMKPQQLSSQENDSEGAEEEEGVCVIGSGNARSGARVVIKY